MFALCFEEDIHLNIFKLVIVLYCIVLSQTQTGIGGSLRVRGPHEA
jgi:hypothetical protein